MNLLMKEKEWTPKIILLFGFIIIMEDEFFYTGLGHTNESYADARFQKMIKGAILWAANIK